MFSDHPQKSVIYWLASGCVLIFLMVVIGGITRLTGSGLSMVDWNLVMGAIPPLNEAEWQSTFQAYQTSPEFKIKNADFTLSDFKSIFWWEYIHRLLGRLIGLVFIIPFIYFIWKKKIDRPLINKLIILLVMGGFQGLLGWYMVKSGLVNVPHVSHYRLAAHLITAFLTFGYAFWIMLSLIYSRTNGRPEWVVKAGRVANLLLLLVLLQIIYGAFVAGLKAGLFYTTFPKMGEDWIAEGVYAMTPWYVNFIEGIAGVQFIHRYLAIGIAVVFTIFLIQSRRNDWPKAVKSAIQWGFGVVVIQFLLGVFTLVNAVPLILAVLHQVGAFFLLAALIVIQRVIRFQKPLSMST